MYVCTEVNASKSIGQLYNGRLNSTVIVSALNEARFTTIQTLGAPSVISRGPPSCDPNGPTVDRFARCFFTSVSAHRCAYHRKKSIILSLSSVQTPLSLSLSLTLGFTLPLTFVLSRSHSLSLSLSLSVCLTT